MTILVFLLAVLGLAVGCGKRTADSSGSETSPAASRSSGGSDAAQVARQAAQTVTQVVQTVQETAQKVQETAVATTEKAQALLTQAKALLAEKKVQEAGTLLDQLAGLTLSPEQQQLLSGLKTELSQLTAEVEKGLAQVKTLITEKNYSEATALVSRLANYQLSPPQQQVLDGLKAELQKLAASQAAQQGGKALGNLLQGK